MGSSNGDDQRKGISKKVEAGPPVGTSGP